MLPCGLVSGEWLDVMELTLKGLYGPDCVGDLYGDNPPALLWGDLFGEMLTVGDLYGDTPPVEYDHGDIPPAADSLK